MSTPFQPKISLAAYYDVVMGPRGFKLAPHHVPICMGLEDSRISNLMFIGPPGCLSGDTLLNLRRGKRNHGRAITIAEAWAKMQGLPVVRTASAYDGLGRATIGIAAWKGEHDCFLPAFKGDRVGYHRVAGIVQSGRKVTYTVTADNGQSLRVTAEHPFRVPDGTPGADAEGFRPLKDLRPGDTVLVRSREKLRGGRQPNRLRRVIYSVPYHPHGWRNVVNGKDYKRIAYARLLYEASMNGLAVDDLIQILRTDPQRAEGLTYLDPSLDVHHRNGDPMDDRLDNLEALPQKDHAAEHGNDNQKNFGDVLATEARIVSIELYGEEMTYDVVMDAPFHNYVAHDFIVHNTGKSTLLAVAYPTWRLGHQPETTILGISAGEKLITTFIHASAEIIQGSEHFVRLFPNVRPDIQAGWSNERGLFVTGRPVGDQDASYFAAGLKSKALTGVHAREIIIDDPHDDNNSATPEGREDVLNTYYTTVIGRGDPRGVRYVLAGRRWAGDDLYGHLKDSGEWVVLHIPAIRSYQPGDPRNMIWYDVTVPRGQTNVFTETLEPLPDAYQDPDKPFLRYRAYYGMDATGEGFYWPGSPSKRKEAYAVRRGRPKVFQSTYNGEVEANDDALFEREDFRAYAPPEGLEMGRQSPEVRAFIVNSKGRVVGAWDTAFGQSQSESNTANLVGLLVPCKHWHNGEDPAEHGPAEFHYDVYLLDLFVASIDARKLVLTFRSQHNKWGANPEIVEEKASGISLIQTMRGSDIPIKPHKVVEGKIERATMGVGGGPLSVQGWVKMGRVHVPAGPAWVKPFLDRVLAYSNDKAGRSDEFDAFVHLVTHAIEASVRTAKIPASAGDLDIPIPLGVQPGIIDTRAQTLQTFRDLAAAAADPMAQAALNPWQGLCGGKCWAFGVKGSVNWCEYHQRQTTSIDGCDRWSETPPADPLRIGPNLHG